MNHKQKRQQIARTGMLKTIKDRNETKGRRMIKYLKDKN